MLPAISDMVMIVVVVAFVLWRIARQGTRSVEVPDDGAYADLPYVAQGRYITGGRYGTDPVTGELGYDRWPFPSVEVAQYVLKWLISPEDRRSLQMVWFDWAKGAPAREAAAEIARKDASSHLKALTREKESKCPGWHYEDKDECSCSICGHDRRILAVHRVPPAQFMDPDDFELSLWQPDEMRYIPRRERRRTNSTGPW